MALALALIRYLKQSLAGTLPRFILPEVDLWVLGFSIGISAGAGLLFGLVPSLQALRGRFGDALREGGSRGALGVRSRASSVFVIAEVALTLTLLCGAGLLLRTFLEVQYGDPGFDSDRLLTFGIALPEDEYPSAEQRIAFHDRLLAQLDTIPSAELAASTLALPRSRGVPIDTVEIEGRDLGDASAPRTSWLAVSPDYLEALRIPLLRGRGLESSDRADALPVVVVDEDFVTRFLSPDDRDGQSLGNGSVIGRRIVFQGESREIVGVARSVRQRRIGSIDGPMAQVYVPFAQAPRRATSYVVKVAIGEPAGLAGPVRDAVWSIDPNLPVADLMTLDEHIAIQLSGLDVFTSIIAGFSGFALILAALGVYGVLAYSVAQRTQEIGVRMALGARRREIIAMVLRQGAILTAIGLAIGVPMVWGVEKMVASALSGLSVVAGPTIAWVALVLVVTAAVASLLPARRASGIAPTVALRQE
jgi:predicted permease